MKKTITFLMMTLVFATFASAQKANLLSETTLFTSDATLQRKVIMDESYTTVSGSKNGVKYRYYLSDASGSFEAEEGRGLELTLDNRFKNWSVQCKKDAIDDSKMCYLNLDLDLFLFMQADGEMRLSVGASRYPGSSIAIRVDDKPAFVANERAAFSGAKAKEIVEAIKGGKQVITRYDKWPQGTNDATFGTYGFAEAVEYLRWALTQIK